MMTVIALLLILRLGMVLTVGFEQILLQQRAVGAEAAQVIDTFTYFRGCSAATGACRRQSAWSRV